MSDSATPWTVAHQAPLSIYEPQISLLEGLSKAFSSTTVQSINSLAFSHIYGSTLTTVHDYWKNHSLMIGTFVGKVMSLLFITRSRFIRACLSLDRKEIKPVNPKGNQPWLFTGRTDAEAEAPILRPPDANSWLNGKIEEKGEGDDRKWDGWMASPTQWTSVWANSRRW